MSFARCKNKRCRNPLCEGNKSGFCGRCNQQQDEGGLSCPTPEEILKLAAEIRANRRQLSPREEYKRAIMTYRHPRVCKVH